MNKINIILLILVLASAFAVVTVQDRSRQFFIALDKAQKGESLLNEDLSNEVKGQGLMEYCFRQYFRQWNKLLC